MQKPRLSNDDYSWIAGRFLSLFIMLHDPYITKNDQAAAARSILKTNKLLRRLGIKEKVWDSLEALTWHVWCETLPQSGSKSGIPKKMRREICNSVYVSHNELTPISENIRREKARKAKKRGGDR